MKAKDQARGPKVRVLCGKILSADSVPRHLVRD